VEDWKFELLTKTIKAIYYALRQLEIVTLISKSIVPIHTVVGLMIYVDDQQQGPMWKCLPVLPCQIAAAKKIGQDKEETMYIDYQILQSFQESYNRIEF